MDSTSFTTMIVGLFAITAQIAAPPIYVAATAGQTGEQQRKTALIATATYVVGGLITPFVGNAALGFFGVSVAALSEAHLGTIAGPDGYSVDVPRVTWGKLTDQCLGDLPETVPAQVEDAWKQQRVKYSSVDLTWNAEM